MEESLLLKLASVVSLLGIVCLFLLAKHIELNDTSIGRIESSRIVLRGNVKSVRQTENAAFLVIIKEEDVNAVAFSNRLNISAGDAVEIEGRASTGKGSAFIIESIKVVG